MRVDRVLLKYGISNATNRRGNYSYSSSVVLPMINEPSALGSMSCGTMLALDAAKTRRVACMAPVVHIPHPSPDVACMAPMVPPDRFDNWNLEQTSP